MTSRYDRAKKTVDKRTKGRKKPPNSKYGGSKPKAKTSMSGTNPIKKKIAIKRTIKW